MRSKFELADIIRRFGRQFIGSKELSPQQNKALYNIVQCRTSAMGGHQEECDHCGTVRYSYNSCGDRHCPKCHSTRQAEWIEKLVNETLPVKHYHIIFTVPHCLNDVCLWDPRMYYNLLFRSVWGTLRSFGYTHYGVETGVVAVLHSWGQNLSLHPHIHCIVPAAGYSLKGQWKHIGQFENYLYPVHQLSETLRGKFLDSLKRKLKKEGVPGAFNQQIQDAWKTNWVVHCEASLTEAEHVIRYLGQYTHRVAITNQRILDISDTHVTFIAKDYRDRAQKKPVTMQGAEFLRRFCLHIMPKGLVRIRRFGIYNPTTKRNLALQFVQKEKTREKHELKNKKEETTAERIRRLTGIDVEMCPVCKKGKMHITRDMPRIRSPAGHLPKMLWAKLQ